MRPVHFRTALPLLAAVFLSIRTAAQESGYFKQTTRAVSPAENWKPVVLTGFAEVPVAAPPDAAQTAMELTEVKKKMAEVDEKIRRQILYWDAGPPAYRWNELAAAIITLREFNSFFRFPSAWMNLAIYDATLAAWNIKYQYNRKRPYQADASLMPLVAPPPTPSYPCEHTVTAAAAATVLAYFFPQKADSIMNLAKQASQTRIYAGLQYPSDVVAAWMLGEEVAKKIIELAKKDGASIPFKGEMPKESKYWQGPYPVGIQVKNYRPFLMRSSDQFRPPAPPDFAKDMEELKTFKPDFRSNAVALKWASYSGIDIWTELAGRKIFEYHLDRNTPECARIYALLHTVMYDAGIAIMDAKYAHWGIRPDQYDKNFQPLIPTPPFPGYPSGHATNSSAAATVLSYFFPLDKPYFKQLAEECAESRFYAGIHFRTDNETGLKMGEQMADFMIGAWNTKYGKAGSQ